MYFTGDTIYSYGSHFPIAQLTTAPNGEDVLLFTTDTYSNTTTRHISYVQQGIRNTRRRVVYCFNPQGDRPSNIRDFKQRLEKIQAKHAKARKPELYSAEIFRIAAQCRGYCEVMCLPVPVWAELRPGIERGEACD